MTTFRTYKFFRLSAACRPHVRTQSPSPCRPYVGPNTCIHTRRPRVAFRDVGLSSALCRPPAGEKLISAILLSCSNRLLRFSGSTTGVRRGV